jgi:hypothetical protein
VCVSNFKIFLLFAWIPTIESLGISRFYCYPLILVLAPIPWSGKRYITIPRLGAVEFGEKRKARSRNRALIGIIAIILMLPLVIVMLAGGLPGGLTWKMVALFAAPVVAIGILLLDFPRMFIYMMLFIYSIFGSEFLIPHIGGRLGNLIAYGTPGAAILGYGFFLLYRFLKKYPRTGKEAFGANPE